MNQIAKPATQVATIDPETLILKALESNVSVESLERLLSMREQLKAEQSREAFFNALAEFQSKCPPIKKDKEVKGRNGEVRYRYAPIESIIAQVSPALKECGFSYTFNTDPNESGIMTTCSIHHQAGHTERTQFFIPVDPEAYMNDAQKAGSASSYGKRYTFCNGFGISTADPDDDAAALGGGITAQDIYRRAVGHMAALWDNLDSVLAIKECIAEGRMDSAYEAWHELSEPEQRDLWLAPTKGGCFTTAERQAIRDVAEAKAREMKEAGAND